MKYTTVGVVDYKMGNHASVVHSIRDLGFRVRVSTDPEVLSATDVLVLPGVGAFPAAMQALREHDLIDYIREEARLQRPILGICLGMQLLATASLEHTRTPGLDLIPGEVVELSEPKWHIGWNTIECLSDDPMLRVSDGKAFYFNHSFCYQGSAEYQPCVTRQPRGLAAVIRRDNVVGVQFHPEKSQAAGKVLLRSLIEGMKRA